ncbi:MAG: B12-binding domain-containing radical SAM protein [Pirellulales bacterium]
MHIVLWDTRKLGVSKDFAGGFGVGQYHGGGFRGSVVRYFYTRDRRPVALQYAYLAAIFRRLGHTVEYAEDRIPAGADLYVFNPSLITLHLERRAIAQVLAGNPAARVMVVGLAAHTLSEMFAGPRVTVVRGEAEQLWWKLDEVLADPSTVVDAGTVADLDALPLPDWSLFNPRRFRIGYDFWKFPTGLVQQSRGCTFKCNYCPYIIVENATRFRDPERVAAEMHLGMKAHGFQSYKFRDPLFGLDRQRLIALAEAIGRLPRKVQFSIESRIELLPPEVLRLLKEVGLTSITVGIESPEEDTLRQYRRKPIRDDRQRQFVADCRGLGIRTVAGFLIGFPEDTESSIRAVLRYAKAVNPTFANFNIVTPYPGTEFFEQVRGQIDDFDYSRYDVYTPVMKYRNLSAWQVAEGHAKCFNHFYFSRRYLHDNWRLLWPWLARLIPRPVAPAKAPLNRADPPKPHAAFGAHGVQAETPRKEG